MLFSPGVVRNLRGDFGVMKRGSAIRWVMASLVMAAAVVIAARAGMQRRAPADTARQICAQRLARLGNALLAYAKDHDGRFPVADTPAQADSRLLPLLRTYGLTKEDFFCPSRPGLPYVYHCYRRLGPGGWPRWMSEKHLVSLQSPAETWLMADYLSRDAPGPHSRKEKAFNYLRVDGSVRFQDGRPRDVYR